MSDIGARNLTTLEILAARLKFNGLGHGKEIMSDETRFRLRAVVAVLVWMFIALFLTGMWLAAAETFNRAPWACGTIMFLLGVCGPTIMAAFWNRIPGGKS